MGKLQKQDVAQYQSTPVSDVPDVVIDAPSDIAPHTLKKKRKPIKRKPTNKQLALAELLLNNVENVSLYKLMIKAGYSKNSAINPSHITEQPSFIQLMDDYGMTDRRLNEVLSDGLLATQYTKDGEPVPDHGMRHRYLETALKVKGMTQPKERAPGGNTYNTFVQQNNINPNAPENSDIVANTLDMLMQATKRPE